MTGENDQMSRLPENQAAWALAPKSKPFVVKEAPYPTPDANEVVVKNYAVAVNPCDYMLQDTAFLDYITYPNIFGVDVAGEVVEVGSNVTDVAVGQRVIGHAFGMDSSLTRHAGFQHYTALLSSLTCPLPAEISFAQGSVLPCALSTAAAGLYQEEDLHLQYPSLNPEPSGKTLLVWGGASSVGSCAIQLAKASGYEVLATASPQNHDQCLRLGASKVFDYRSDSVVEDIAQTLGGTDFVGVFDAISKRQTVQMCVNIVHTLKQDKKVVLTNPIPDGVVLHSIDAKAVLAGTIVENDVCKAVYRDFLPEALAKKIFQATPEPLVVGHGLGSVQLALDRVRQGMNAQKAVVTLGESP
ncbi:Polyketide synthase enoylreductase [Penicillium macrosclerotiorum]|uniref:Polyketide synthase enoylreductase n=1 Tax=Penicillium macrosclerotiorum TaxID=303699 RepID=UPI0025498E03|nr:Polyketide synthase enoylreductase [Penicillium macrosclerotiorum]KAJ5688946.1 Polyketide synthase enoylreductase [Penicillium macrosclerotiorum]